MTILVVEDDPVTLRLLEMTLTRCKYAVATAVTAREAIERLKSDAGVELVISDVGLEDMSGLELLTTVQANVRWRNIPVIMCTGMSDSETVREAIRLGARHYLVKPIRPSLLLEKIAFLLGRRQLVFEPCYETMARLGLSESEYVNLVEASIGHLDTLLAALSAARAADDSVETNLAARRIREPAALLGALRCTTAIDGLDAATTQAERDRALALVLEEVGTLRQALTNLSLPGKVPGKEGQGDRRQVESPAKA